MSKQKGTFGGASQLTPRGRKRKKGSSVVKANRGKNCRTLNGKDKGKRNSAGEKSGVVVKWEKTSGNRGWGKVR